MAHGRTHAGISIGLGIGAGVVGHALPVGAGLPFALGALLGVLLTPDHDVDGGNISHQYVGKLGVIPKWLWRVLWKPYALRFAHRSFLSHFPVISTTYRLIYLVFPAIILFTPGQNMGKSLKLIGGASGISFCLFWPITYLLYWLGYYDIYLFVFLGLVLSDVLHYIADFIW